MLYSHPAIPESEIPQTYNPLLQHILDTYVSESNKVAAVWREFGDGDLHYKPHPRSMTVGDILNHQLLSERRFFGNFLGTTEAAPEEIVPKPLSLGSAMARYVQLVRNRLPFFAAQDDDWWLQAVPFFDVERQRIWIFWRRVLHTAHHRAQLATYLRALDRKVPAIYGPTADDKWEGADPTTSVAAAGR